MKKHTLYLFVLSIVFAFNTQGQSTAKDPLAYLEKVSDGQAKTSREFLGYISAVSHGKSARKVSQQRSELLSAVTASRARVSHLPDFQGDTSLRWAAYNYFNITYIVLKEDYAKIMDLEEISEQSYDNMEAYITMQKKASEKVKEAFDKCEKEFRAFAAKNNITLRDENTVESKKMEKVGLVTNYYNNAYLPFFKCNKGELYMVNAVSKKDLNALEQTKVALQGYIEESTAKLNAIEPFEGDASMVNTSKKVLEFYQSEIKDKMPIVNDYIMKSEKFDKLKAAMDKKSPSERTKEDIEQYNAAVNDMNAASNNYNKVIGEMNNSRAKLINEWNKVANSFMDKHMPVYNH